MLGILKKDMDGDKLLAWSVIGILGLMGMMYQPPAPVANQNAYAAATATHTAKEDPDDGDNSNSSMTDVVDPSTVASSPNTLKFSLSLASPQDLKVHQGDSVVAGQTIADREEERRRLTAERETLALALEKVQGSAVTQPTSPLPVPSVNKLPPESLVEEETAIANSALAVQQAEKELAFQQERSKSSLEESSAVRRAEVSLADKQRTLDIQHRKLDAVQGMTDLPPSVMLHEQVVLKQRETEVAQAQTDLEQARIKEVAAAKDRTEKLQHLVTALEKAQAEHQLAIAKLQTKKDHRSYQEYEASVTEARRAEEKNHSEAEYTRQMQESENHQRDRSYQVSQIQAKLGEIDTQLAALSIVKSPYAGVIKKVKVTGQNDRNLSLEVVLVTNNGNGSAASTASVVKGKGNE